MRSINLVLAGFVFAGGQAMAEEVKIPVAAPAAPPAAKVDAKAAAVVSEKYFCSGCHGTEEKIVGPGFKEVAAKYKTDKDASAKLLLKIKNGGAGAWGAIPMPPTADIKDEEATTMLTWILSL